jgi:hypothetical protein
VKFSRGFTYTKGKERTSFCNTAVMPNNCQISSIERSNSQKVFYYSKISASTRVIVWNMLLRCDKLIHNF